MLRKKLKKFTSALYLSRKALLNNRVAVKIVLMSVVLSVGVKLCAGQYYDGQTGQPTKLESVLAKIESGTVLIASELHDHASHHQNQRDLLVSVSGAKFSISVGMEFFSYPDQKHVDDYITDKIDEATFLKAIKWDGAIVAGLKSFLNFLNFPFEFYRFQVRLPAYRNGKTLALNFPRELSGKVAKGGLDALTADEKAMMPPQFERGADTYFERFHDVMKDHAKEEQIQNYFTAQSLWDDTMAWQAQSYMAAHPDNFLMIIVGDFHVAYQDGLVARLKKRGLTKVVVVSQVDTSGQSESDKKATIAPDNKYGARADFVFDSEGN